MIKKICNYSAVFLLSLIVLAGAVSANPHKGEPIKVREGSFNFYNKFLTAKNPQAYGITVKDGQTTRVKIHSLDGVSVKLFMPNGEVREYGNEQTFNLEFHAAGEYIVQLSSTGISKYTFQATSK